MSQTKTIVQLNSSKSNSGPTVSKKRNAYGSYVSLNTGSKPRSVTLRLRKNNSNNNTRKKLKNKNERLDFDLDDVTQSILSSLTPFETMSSVAYSENNQAPFQLFPLESTFGTEEHNIGTIEVAAARKRAQVYLQEYYSKFTSASHNNSISLSDVFGILIHFGTDLPMAFDPTTTLQNSVFRPLTGILDSTNEPIFILHKAGVSRVTPDDVRKKYSSIFTPVNS